MEKIKELRSKTLAELSEMEQSLAKEAMNLRFQQTMGTLKNTARRRQVRRTIAKIKTVQAEKSGSENK